MKRAVFLDRDGIINATLLLNGITVPPRNLKEFKFMDGIDVLCRQLKEKGYLLIIVTNQPDVARGTQSKEIVEQINDHITQKLPIDAVYVCYHDNKDACECRKPKPGMLLMAARDKGINLGQSFILGDRWSDILAGQQAGCKTILLLNDFDSREKCTPDFSLNAFNEIETIIPEI